MVVGHSLARSVLTNPEISSNVCHDSFCQLGSSVSLPWVHNIHNAINISQNVTKSLLTSSSSRGQKATHCHTVQKSTSSATRHRALLLHQDLMLVESITYSSRLSYFVQTSKAGFSAPYWYLSLHTLPVTQRHGCIWGCHNFKTPPTWTVVGILPPKWFEG